jgi:hypothetical protein
MPLLGFTVFKEKILDGTKTQTIRKMRKHPIKLGDHLYIYWHPRQKDCTKLGDATCRDVFNIRMSIVVETDRELFPRLSRFYLKVLTTAGLMDIKELTELAHKDGFENVQDMANWFHNKYGFLNQELLQVIRWYPLVTSLQLKVGEKQDEQ